MCEYVKNNNCVINKSICPFVYFCNDEGKWKPSKNMPKNCKVKNNISPPQGYFEVVSSNNKTLYVKTKTETKIFKNEYTNAPRFVKIKANKIIDVIY